MLRSCLRFLYQIDGLILCLVCLGVGCFLGSGFMLAGKRSHESQPVTVVDTYLAARTASDLAAARRDIESLREHLTKNSRVGNDCLWNLIVRLDWLEKKVGSRPKTPPGIPYTVDLPAASFGPEPERIAPQEIPFPIEE